MFGELIKLIPQFDVISFDIFDTLLLRTYVNPQDLWRDIEVREDAEGFFKARQKADVATYRAATEKGGEHTLDEAYALMGAKWGSFRQKELEYESRALAANPEMVAAWNHAGELGKRRVIVSDVYLPANFIQERLRACGVDGWDGFYLSCERQKRKTTGELFELMLREQKVEPDRVLHIGDNERSDRDAAEKVGVSAVCCPRIMDLFLEENPFVTDFLRHDNSPERSRMAGALARGWHRYKYEHPQATFWSRLGFMMGGVLGYMYIRWMGEMAREKGINHLMFVGRDGYIWEKICKMMFPDIRTDYFYAPRITSILLARYRGRKPEVVQDRCRSAVAYLRNEHGIEVSEDEIAVYMENGEFPARVKDAVEAVIADMRESYRSYLAGFSVDPKRAALVDGCSSEFSAQRLVESVVGEDVFTFYLLSMSELVKGAAFYKTVDASLPFQMLSEFIFGSPTPPVARMAKDGPVFAEKVFAWESFKMSVCGEMADGAVACARELTSADIVVDARSWRDYFVAFSQGVNRQDGAFLDFARNAMDVEQHCFKRIIKFSPTKRRDIVNLLRMSVLSVRYKCIDGNVESRLYVCGVPTPIVKVHDNWPTC